MIDPEPDERPICTPVASGEAAWRSIAELHLTTLKLRDLRIAELERQNENLLETLASIQARCESARKP